jgi:hypothetical protein
MSSESWAAFIVASSAGVLLLGFTCFVAALARRYYLRRRIHAEYPHDYYDDDGEAGAFAGVYPGVAWGETASSDGERGTNTQLSPRLLPDQFLALLGHPPYDAWGRVEAEVEAVMHDMVAAVVGANPVPPPRQLQLPPPPRTPQQWARTQARAPLALPAPSGDAVRLVRARSEAHRKQLEGLRAIKRRFMERTKQIYGDEHLSELITMEGAVDSFLRAGKQGAGTRLPAPPPPQGVEQQYGSVGDEQQRSNTGQHAAVGTAGAATAAGAAAAGRDGQLPVASVTTEVEVYDQPPVREGRGGTAGTSLLTHAEEEEVDGILDGVVAGIVKERITALLETQQQQRGGVAAVGDAAGGKQRVPAPPAAAAAVAADGAGRGGGATVPPPSLPTTSLHCIELPPTTFKPSSLIHDSGNTTAMTTMATLDTLDSSHTRLPLRDIAEDRAREWLESSALQGAVERGGTEEEDEGEGDSNDEEESGVGDGDVEEYDEEGMNHWPIATVGVALAHPSASTTVSKISTEDIAERLASLSSEAAGRPRRAPKGTKKSKGGSKQLQPSVE